MEKFTVHTGQAAPLRRSDVDTDQIAPARFLVTTTRTGFSDVLFHDWRLEKDFVLNDPRYAGASIIVAGPGFGTGSSREYAVWALADYGIRAVIAPKFGDIFYLNALKNSVVPAIVPEEIVQALWALLEEQPAAPVTVDLVERTVSAGDVTASFPVDDYTRMRLMQGLDETALTLTRAEEIDKYEQSRRQSLPRTVRSA